MEYKCYTCAMENPETEIFEAGGYDNPPKTCPLGHNNMYWANIKDDLNK